MENRKENVVFKREKYSVTEYEGPKGPASRVDEWKLVASCAMSENVYEQVNALKLPKWYFADLFASEIFEAIEEHVNKVGYGKFKASMRAKGDIALRNGLDYMTQNIDYNFYINDLKNLGVDPFHILLLTHIKDRQEYEAPRIFSEISFKIFANKSIAEECAKLSSLIVGHDVTPRTGAKRMSELMDQMNHETACEFGLAPLDKLVRIGFGGQLVILSGESSTGKTSLANQLTCNYLDSRRGSVLYFSTETSIPRLGMRFVQFLRGNLDCTYETAKNHLEFYEGNLIITDSVREIGAICRMIREEKEKTPELTIIVVDYLQNLVVDGVWDDTQRITKSVMALHEICQELQIVMVLLCQLIKDNNRNFNGKNASNNPTLNSLRGASQIGNSADIVIVNQFTGPPEYGGAREIDLHVVKNKEGEQNKVRCNFLGKYVMFDEKEVNYNE